MKLGVLFSGGKDSAYAAYIAKQHGHDITCLITIVSKNPHSYMFHTPLINNTKKQAKRMHVPIILRKTKGIKEAELEDLEYAILEAVEKHKIEGIVTGAVESI